MSILVAEGAIRLAVSSPYTVAWYEEGPDELAVQRAWDAYRKVLRQIPPGQSMYAMTVVADRAQRFKGEGRQRSMAMGAELQSRTGAAVVVLLGRGLLGAIQRSITATFFMVNRPPHPVEVTGTPGDGARWLCEQAGSPGQAQQLLDMLVSLGGPP